jgi:CHAD domain-containing protein
MRSPEPAFDLRAALSEELRAALEEYETADGDPAGVHRCRVRVKRARALARIGRPCAPGLSAVFNDSARAVMRQLAATRDLAALSEAARHLAGKQSKSRAAALSAVAERLDSERDALPAVDAPAMRAALKDLLALAQVWPEASTGQIRRGAKRVLRRARLARRRGRGSDDPARRHEWRKREKDRFYAALLLGAAWPTKRRRKISERLANVLGEERDALLLLERVAAQPSLAGDDRAAERAVKALMRRRAKLGKKADDLGKRLHANHA